MYDRAQRPVISCFVAFLETCSLGLYLFRRYFRPSGRSNPWRVRPAGGIVMPAMGDTTKTFANRSTSGTLVDVDGNAETATTAVWPMLTFSCIKVYDNVAVDSGVVPLASHLKNPYARSQH